MSQFRDGAGVSQHLTAAAHELDSQQAARGIERRDNNNGLNDTNNERRGNDGGWIGGHIDRPRNNLN